MTDQLAILQRDAADLIDENPDHRLVSGALKFNIDKFITLTLNDLFDQIPKAGLFDSHAHNNKKVGGTPTRKSSLWKYMDRLRLNQPVNQRNHLATSTASAAENPRTVLYSRFAMYCRRENLKSEDRNLGTKAGTFER